MLKYISFFSLIVLSAVFCFASDADVKILSSTASSITVEFSPKDWTHSTKTVDLKSYSRFTFFNFSPTTVSGEPELPTRDLLLVYQ